MTGALVAIVGPSGAGKDAVIDQVRAHFADEVRMRFPQRVITRPAGAGEEHIPVSEDEFAVLQRQGGFCLHWDAHGLRYGVPTRVAEEVAAGAVAVVNVSRAALAGIREAFERVHVVRITVPEHVRRERILSRGRETSAEALLRLDRADPAPEQEVDLEIVNDGALADAGASLVAFMREVLEAQPVR